MANLAKQLARIDLYHGEDINNFTDIDKSVERHYQANKDKFDAMAITVIRCLKGKAIKKARSNSHVQDLVYWLNNILQEGE